MIQVNFFKPKVTVTEFICCYDDVASRSQLSSRVRVQVPPGFRSQQTIRFNGIESPEMFHFKYMRYKRRGQSNPIQNAPCTLPDIADSLNAILLYTATQVLSIPHKIRTSSPISKGRWLEYSQTKPLTRLSLWAARPVPPFTR